MVMFLPSMAMRPSAWKRLRLRETSSRTVPICDANSWLLAATLNSARPEPSPASRARRSRRAAEVQVVRRFLRSQQLEEPYCACAFWARARILLH